MDKLKMMSMDKVQANIEKIRALFPNAVTEVIRDGKVTLAVDFDVLKQELADTLIDERELRYQFTWPDKQRAVLLANEPINKTLRPVKIDETTPTGEDSDGNPYCSTGSVDFDTTQNLYIEGDNLEVLKLLQETYLGKIKMIYIDPPYNTGNDFVYEDDFSQSVEEYTVASGQFDDQGNRLFQNTESNGRFHTDWLNMIYPRLRLAKDLLSDDGVIFISIDDNEIENLRKICEEIFGATNFVAQFIWRGGRRNLAKYISTSHEYILCFSKNLQFCSDKNISWHETKRGLNEIYTQAEKLVEATNYNYELASQGLKEWYKTLPDDHPSKDHKHYCWIDKRGVYFASDISHGGGGGPKWEIINPNTGNVVTTPARGWAYPNIEALYLDIEKDMIHFNGDGVPCKKRYLKENETQLMETVFYKDRRGSSKRLRSLFELDVFPFPKDEEVLMKFMKSFTDNDSIIMDFFSGSASTAHAVMQLNAEDGGKRKFIMVQLPEVCDEKSEPYKAGYKNICEIGKERIRRAGAKIYEEKRKAKGQPTKIDLFNQMMATSEAEQVRKLAHNYDEAMEGLDVGFRVLKLDTSNMQPVFYHPEEYKQTLLDDMIDNIKSDRTPLDLLFQVMLDLGKPLSAKIEEREIAGKHVFIVNDDDLIACFDSNVTEETVKAIAQLKPLYAIFRDSSLANDSTAANFDQIFATYSPNTVRKVL